MSLLVVALMAMVATVVYSCSISHAHPEKLWDWFNTLVGSFLSFMLAVISGIWLLNRQNRLSQNKSKVDLELILASEFSDLHRILTSKDVMTVNFPPDKGYSALVTFVQPLAIEKAAQSSLFSPRDTENLLHVARKVRMFQLEVEHFLGLVRSKAFEEYIANATRNLERTREALVNDICQITTQLGLNTRLSDHPDA